MAKLHIHTVHQKRNPLTARLQNRQREFGKALQHALQDYARQMDHLQKRMGQRARLDEVLEKIESQTFRRRAVNGQRTAELLRLPAERVEVGVAERFRETRWGEDSTSHLQLRYRAPELVCRFLDVLNRQYRYGSEPAIKVNVAIRHHVVVSAAGDDRPLGILNVANSQSRRGIDDRAIYPFSVQDLQPRFGIISSNHVESLIDNPSSHAMQPIRRWKEGIEQDFFSPPVWRLKILEHDLVAFKDVPVSIDYLRSHRDALRA